MILLLTFINFSKRTVLLHCLLPYSTKIVETRKIESFYGTCNLSRKSADHRRGAKVEFLYDILKLEKSPFALTILIGTGAFKKIDFAEHSAFKSQNFDK